ncbi:MAG: filamentous hemagglutinin N-terminal domain-containing protein [Verrucomicrobiia bacterium]
MNKGTTIAICALATGAILGRQELRANPQGGTVTAGSATIGATAPNTLTIDQISGRVIINWQDFSINAGEVTRFVQPSATAAALNRVITANPSLLYGTLQANGRIFLINQNGILVGKGGQINTAGFTASTLGLSDTAFLGGKSLHFVGDSKAAIDNFGSITALGGDVFLIAQTVQNSGTIRAKAGEVGLAAGSDVTLVQSGNERLSVLAGNANSPPSAVGVNNVGQIEAAVAELKAAGGNIYALAINNGGVVRATGVASQNGRIVLRADDGNIQNSGTLVANNENGSGGTVIMDGGHNVATPTTVINSGVVQARGDAAGARGGTIEVLGDHVGLFGGAMVDVSGDAGGGTALIGGGLHGQDPSVGNAERTYVDQGATIAADALSRGNGGNVVVWADDATAFYGTISARGGVRGGNGGSAEVSGKEALVYEGFVDLRAPNGVMGDLLLDPHNITIANGGPDAISGNQFFTDNSAGDVTIDPANVVAALNGANLTLQANTDINVNDTIDASGNAGAGNLTLNAGRSITLAGGVSILLQGSFTATINDGGAVTADRDPGAATFSMGAGSSITAPGGIDIEAGTLAADNTGPTSVSANTGDMTLTTLNTAPSSAGAAGGNIVVINNQAAAKSITISGNITASGADNGAGVGGNGGSITLNASGTLTLNVVASNGGNGTGGAGGGAGNVTLTGGNAIAVDGTITAQGGSGSSAGGAGVVALTANGPIAFNDNVTAASIVSHSGGTGSGDTTFGVGVQINADSQSYRAGNGSGSAAVDLTDNTPTRRVRRRRTHSRSSRMRTLPTPTYRVRHNSVSRHPPATRSSRTTGQ